MKGCKHHGFKHKFHESKESVLKEAFEDEPRLHKVPHSSLTYGKVPGKVKVKYRR